MDFTETPISQKYIHRGVVINLRVDEIALPNGGRSVREVVEHGGGVCVAPLTEDGELIFVRQFRYPYRETVLELPAGKLEAGEQPLVCGQRELSEETGAESDDFTSLGIMYPSPGYCGEIIHLYLAKNLRYNEQHLDADEFLSVERIPLDRAVDMVLANQIPDAKTQIAIMKTALLLARESND